MSRSRLRSAGAACAVLIVLLLSGCGGENEDQPELVAPRRTPAPTMTARPTVTASPETAETASVTEGAAETSESTETPVSAGVEVVSLKNEVQTFLTEAADVPLPDRIDIFYRLVSGPAAACFESTFWPEADPLEMLGFNVVSIDLGAWQQTVDAFPESELIQRISDVLEQSQAVLPLDQPLRYCLMPTPAYTFPEDMPNGGVNSSVLGDVVVLTCSAGEFCLETVEREAVLNYAFALQAAQSGRSGVETPLLDLAIYWARAGLLMGEVLPGGMLAWENALDAEQETEYWPRLQENLFITYSQYPEGRRINPFLYGDNDQRQYPAWGAVYVASQILEAYQDSHPEIDLAALFELAPRDIYNESGYEPGQGDEDSGESMSGVGF